MEVCVEGSGSVHTYSDERFKGYSSERGREGGSKSEEKKGDKEKEEVLL